MKFPVWIQRLEFPKKLGICERFFGDGLTAHGICRTMTGAGIEWKLDLRNPPHRWAVYGLYDPPFLSWARGFLGPDAIVVDSGANIGQTVMYLGQYVPAGRLFAFEPGRVQADWLEECMRFNQERLPTVEIVRAGLGDKAQDAFLEDTWKSERFHGGSSQISLTAGEPVRLERLDDFLARQGIDHVDLWKLDVEGYELPALRGAESLLKKNKIKALYVELYRQQGEEFKKNGIAVREYLSTFGYRCHLFGKWSGKPAPEKGLTDAANGLFLVS